MNRKFAFGIAAATLSLPGVADAADMPRKGPPLPTAYNWTGFYVGANAGYGWADGSGTITMVNPVTGVAATGPVTGKGNGISGGAQLGYNYQIGSVVFGAEADFQASGQKGNFDGTAGANTFTSTAKVPWFATARGRIGYAFDRWLVYATGGGVYGDGKVDGTSSLTGPFSASKQFFTYTFGGGVEAALWGRWTAKVEYLYIATPNHVPVPPTTTDISGSITSNLVRAGLNYRF
jgi:outer membrane immunogenic protein